MKPLPHDYDVDLIGGPQGYATVSAAGLADVTVAPPPEYGGPGDAWSPEHLLLASVSSCFMFTFRAVAKASHADFLDVEARTWGSVAKVDGAVRFADIVVRVTVTAAPGSSIELLRRAIDKTASRCLVTSSLAVPVRVEATIQGAAGETTTGDLYQQTA